MKKYSLADTIKELERIYDLIANRYKFKAIKPIITIQSKGRSNATGWHYKNKWKKKKEYFTEINICAEHLKDNPIETLIHEMCHYHNAVEKINDCNSQQYHNKRFKERAEMYGLNVKKVGRFGWAMTSISDKLAEALKKYNINYDVFNIFRTPNIRTKAPTKMKKWRCNCTTIRAAVEIDITCNKCNQKFNLNI